MVTLVYLVLVLCILTCEQAGLVGRPVAHGPSAPTDTGLSIVVILFRSAKNCCYFFMIAVE
jgi:hypothetical protein